MCGICGWVSYDRDLGEPDARGELAGMTATMADLYRQGYGDEVVIDAPRMGITWARFGHLFANFYVFQYATGIAAAAALAKRAHLVICVGTRLTDFPTGSHSLFQHPDVRFASINVTDHDAFKLGALPVLADAREALLAATAAGRDAGLAMPLLPD